MAPTTKLTHSILLKYVLFEGLRTEVDALLQRNSSTGSLKLSWGTKVAKPKDVHDADEVMQWLDDRGIIQSVSLVGMTEVDHG